MQYSETVGDLFKVPTDYVLAHCISADCKMGAGIAVAFRDNFPEMKPYCQSQCPQIGDAILYRTASYDVFNLITKEKYYGKPTYNTLRKALVTMKDEIVRYDYKKIAMPLIGCGLDRLTWYWVREIIQEVFADVDIEILIVHKA